MLFIFTLVSRNKLKHALTKNYHSLKSETMSLLGVDIGGTKVALAIFNNEGRLLQKETAALQNRKGAEVGDLINDRFLN